MIDGLYAWNNGHHMAIQVSTFAPRFERISSSPDVLIEKTKQNKTANKVANQIIWHQLF